MYDSDSVGKEIYDRTCKNVSYRLGMIETYLSLELLVSASIHFIVNVNDIFVPPEATESASGGSICFSPSDLSTSTWKVGV